MTVFSLRALPGVQSNVHGRIITKKKSILVDPKQWFPKVKKKKEKQSSTQFQTFLLTILYNQIVSFPLPPLSLFSPSLYSFPLSLVLFSFPLSISDPCQLLLSVYPHFFPCLFQNFSSHLPSRSPKVMPCTIQRSMDHLVSWIS